MIRELGEVVSSSGGAMGGLEYENLCRDSLDMDRTRL